MAILTVGDDMDEVNNMQNIEKESARSKVPFLVIGWIAAILSLFVYPFIFGIVGVIMGIISTKGGSRAGLSVIIASIVLMGIGLIYSDVILNYARHYLGI
ncbi:MAG: hypothetical protein ACOX7R_01130 [Acetivibrionales bacterium]